MRSRNWSIRSKIIALVAVPVLTLLAQWIFVTTLNAGPVLSLMSAQTLLHNVADPGTALTTDLQKERRLTVEFLSAGDSSPSAALKAQRLVTDRDAAAFRASAKGRDTRNAASDTLRARIDRVVTAVDSLAGNRGHVDRRAIDSIGAQNFYNEIIESSFQMFSTVAPIEATIDRYSRGLITIGRGMEFSQQVDSLLAGAHRAGRLSSQGRTDLLAAISTNRYLLEQGVNDLSERDRVAYRKVYEGPAFTALRKLQDTLMADSRSGAAPPVTAEEWKPAFDATVGQLIVFQDNAADAVADDATPYATKVLLRLLGGGLIGLIALIISLVVSIKIGRSIVGRLGRLRGEALELAGERLPSVVRRLQRGEGVDVDVETPPLEYGRDEIGQLGHAFNEVQRTAVQSAVEEANVRRGINEVFLNIARRSQTLLHRQLALLDRMERRETEPQELEDLYRVDHLATRMRRHAEDLVILAGAAPGRGWRNPVPLIDVVRGAISEVEDYKRVDIVSVESAAVLGRAVGDVIHLLAELLENAASFSPPNTRVQVVGQVLPNGYALDIEDRGLGMSTDAIAVANRKLLEPPDFDPADSARLGLFVVAQLAGRHGIRVSLRPSAYGGVSAIVLIPGDLVTGVPEVVQTGNAPELPAGPADQAWDRPPAGTGTDDPSRRSPAARQWQGDEELRSISVAGRPVTMNGTATAGPELTELEAPPASPSGPTPSAVIDGLTEDGLVQRRRTKPRRASDRPAEPPALLPPNLTSPEGLAPESPSALSSPGRAHQGNGSGLNGHSRNGALLHGEGPAVLPGPRPTHLTPAPRIPSPRVSPESTPPPPPEAGPVEPVIAPAPGETIRKLPVEPEPEGDEPLLPKRVRQASLAPQLRGPVAERVDAAPSRSPEQVRSLMSALQQGTARGRLEAAGLAGGQPPAAPEEQQSTPAEPGTTEAKWSEAATVMIPVVPSEDDSITDKASDENHENRPEKDS
jgi:signal transduction histidine kinase